MALMIGLVWLLTFTAYARINGVTLTGRRSLFRFHPLAGWPLLILVVLLAGCATPAQKAAREQQRAAAARNLFDQTTRQFHLPAGEAAGVERGQLLQQAAAGYERLLRQYPDQPLWCAMAERSLGNVRATQGRLDEAVRLYACVAERYPTQDWEILQAWKSAADLLWEAGRPAAAGAFDRKIVKRFDQPDQPAVIMLIVRAVQRRLAGATAHP